jgi:centrosomal protein CEP290
VDQLASDKASLLTAQEELKAEVAEKVGLLDEFEARFQRQYKWVLGLVSGVLGL